MKIVGLDGPELNALAAFHTQAMLGIETQEASLIVKREWLLAASSATKRWCRAQSRSVGILLIIPAQRFLRKPKLVGPPFVRPLARSRDNRRTWRLGH